VRRLLIIARGVTLMIRAAFLFVLLLALGVTLQPKPSAAQSAAPVQIINGHPQFQLHGQPFFAHSTAFFYNRLPRDEWGVSLAKLKALGINTIDLYLAWNWHEPEEGKLDFDGHTNPRRDVKGLLAMLDEMGFAVIARPGPVILNEWRNGGYPDWLLARPEYGMHEAARRDGHYPPLAALNPINSEEASRQWLANKTHLQYTQRWFATVMRELLKDRQAPNGGNLIAIQLDDDQAINRANYNGPVFWQYMNTLAAYLREAGATVPVYLNPTDMRVSAAGAAHQIGVMGQWYFNFGSDPALRWEDTAVLQFYTETLKTQPHFPPMIIEYQAGWYGTGEDIYAKTADPTNTLLSSRVMIGHGLRGLNYFPVQDTLYPAGYEVPWANHYYIWESALNLNRAERPRAEAVHRNGRLIAGLGRELATAHKAADLGLIYPISSFDQAALTRDDVLRISQAQMQVQQFCQLNQIAVEYLDLEFQPLEHLKRHKALLLPVFDETTLSQASAQGREEISAANEPTGRRGDKETGKGGEGARLRLSEVARRKLIEYVQAGGTLICTPTLPPVRELNGHPRVLVVPDYWRTIPIEPGKVKRDEVINSVQTAAVEFVSRLTRLGINRRVKARVTKGGAQAASAAVGATIEPDLVATQLIPDSGGGAAGYSFINVINFDSRQAMQVRLNIANTSVPDNDPTALRVARLELPEFTLRARDALLLPVHLPLFDGAEIYYATAELTHRAAANGRIALRFYAPDTAELVLRLPRAPQGAVTIDGAPAESSYDPVSKLLKIKLAAPRRGQNTRDADELADRRTHEHDVEIVYEKGLPELNIKTTRLISSADNQVLVEVANRTAQARTGKLQLTATRLFKTQQFSRDVTLQPQETKQFTFSLPLPAHAVADDQVVLRALLIEDNNATHHSPTTSAAVRPRFEWQITPVSTWPLRADTLMEIKPPLLYPSDDNATSAQFNLRLGNNSAEPITLTRTSILVNSLPLKLAPDEEVTSTYTYNFAPGTRSALNPFVVNISDGRTTEAARMNFVALRKGEAVAFAYDIDRDGFDDYVMENEHLRLIISPNAGARAFALINKRTGANVFTSVGGLRDKFVQLDPQDPTRNPRRKRGMYGTFNRAYVAEIIEGIGQRAVIKLSYDAPDVYPAPIRIARTITLPASEEFFIVDYQVTPQAGAVDAQQAFWSANSIIVGDPAQKARRFVAADGPFDFAAGKTRLLPASSGWLSAALGQNTFAVLWRAAEVNVAEVEMKDFSSLVNVKFKPFVQPAPHTYRLAFYFGGAPPERIAAQQARILQP
jgi:hypothetical protein